MNLADALDQHPEFAKITADSAVSPNGLKRQCRKTVPVDTSDELFKRVLIFIENGISTQQIPLRLRENRGSMSWLPLKPSARKPTIMKLLYYGKSEYFVAVREETLRANNLIDTVIQLSTHQLTVPPSDVSFIGFPILEANDLDKITKILSLFPNSPQF